MLPDLNENVLLVNAITHRNVLGRNYMDYTFYFQVKQQDPKVKHDICFFR